MSVKFVSVLSPRIYLQTLSELVQVLRVVVSSALCTLANTVTVRLEAFYTQNSEGVVI